MCSKNPTGDAACCGKCQKGKETYPRPEWPAPFLHQIEEPTDQAAGEISLPPTAEERVLDTFMRDSYK